MEMQQVVVLTETGKLQLTSLSRHTIFHAAQVLLPNQSMHTVLPKSGSRKIENFCNELPQVILAKNTHRKKGSISETLLTSSPFVASIEIHKFLERAISISDFTLLLENNLLESSGGELDPDKLHELCWTYYHMEKQTEISIPQWFSTTCTYRLWLIFCCVQEQALTDKLPAMTANEVIKRLVELCGFTWNESYRYAETDELDFPQYLHAIASYFTRLRLEMSLTCEVIVDMVDEIVHGVLKKGYLIKKGHKRKNWKKRWFVLQRTIMKYFDSRETMAIKGQLVLNSKTEVKGMPDKGKRRYSFEVTCGHTGIPFEICADDQRTKHEWMLAIRKAIALAKVLEGSTKQDEFTEYLTGFYLLKYGTPKPSLSRQDSTVRNMKYHATMKDQRKRLSGKSKSRGIDISKERAGSTGEEGEILSPQDEYMEMSPLDKDENIVSDDSSDEGESYTSMGPITEFINTELSKSTELLDLGSSCPTTGVEFGFDHERLSKSYSLSHTVKLPLPDQSARSSITESIHSSDGYPSDDNYDEAELKPRYGLKMNDPQLGGYIHFPKRSASASAVQTTQSLGSPVNGTTLTPLQEEVGMFPARGLVLDRPILEPEPKEALSPTQTHTGVPNKYLTIIRDPSRDGPPVPTHKRTPTPERILNSEVTFSRSSEGPPPPPRQKLMRDSSLPSPTMTTYAPPRQKRGSEPNITSSLPTSSHNNTKAKQITPPPLPPR